MMRKFYLAILSVGLFWVTLRGQNVGIGIATPAEKLHVIGDLRLQSNSDVTNTVGSGVLQILNSAGTAGVHIDVNEIQSVGTDLYINLDNAQNTRINNFAYFTTTQRLGLGVAVPTERLHVNGNVRVTGLAGTGTRPVYATAPGVLTTTPPNPDVFWRTSGNTGITTAHFLGTINNADLNIRTNNTLRFRIENWGARLRANDNGSATSPNYSWIADTDIGMYRITTNTLGFSTAGVERFRLETGEAVVNEVGADYDFRVESDNEFDALVVLGSNGAVGFQTYPSTPNLITGGPYHEIFWPVEIGRTTAHTRQATIGYWRGSDVLVKPESDMFGYCGDYGEAWWRAYAYGFVNASDRKKKKDIVSLADNQAVASIVLKDIENLNPTLYNYKGEHTTPVNSYDTKVRYQYHLGFLADEVPAYVSDETFTAVNIYNLATLAATGAKYNLQAVKKLTANIAYNDKVTVEDFGTVQAQGNTLHISFDKQFSEILNRNSLTPTILLQVNAQNVSARITHRDAQGFTVQLSQNVSNITLDWNAKVKVPVTIYPEEGNVSPTIAKRIIVPQEVRKTLQTHYANIPTTQESPKEAEEADNSVKKERGE